jgi:serine/threonine-protein kinase HipA
MAKSQRLRVYLDGDPIGYAEQSSGSLSFIYDEEYRSEPNATPLSLSMPLASPRHGNRPVRAFLDGLLPDSQPARERWATQYGVSANNPFGLLAHVGRDAAGAVQVLPPEEESDDAVTRHGDIEWLGGDDFTTLARELAEHGAEWDPGRYGGRWSLAGAQPKIALFFDDDTGRWGIPRDSTPTTAIVKPAIEGYHRHHINEALCLRAAANVGLLAARVDLVEVADVQAVISHRYDRRQDADGRWLRVHQEDMCQALSVHPSQKYQSEGGPGVADIGRILSGLAIGDRLVSGERFFKGLAFNVLIGGADAHAKNYSLLLIGPRAQVAPLYDVASAACYDQHQRLDSAMKVGEHWRMLDVTEKDWRVVARQLDIPGDQAMTWVADLRAQLPEAFAAAIDSLPDDVRGEAGHMADRIIEHVQGAWRPSLDHDPRYVLDAAKAQSTILERPAASRAARSDTWR